ncbi:MAG: GDP-mannose 4,6-dehydratase [Terriglobia bacterium]
MKCLITGGGGFAGSHLAEYLIRQGEEVAIFVLPHDPLGNLVPFLSEVRVERGDLLDGGRVADVLRDLKPQRIYHLAAISSPADSFSNPKASYDVNFTGTFNLLWAWRQLEIDSRLLYVSSSAVYGWVSENELPLSEDAPFRPLSPYGGSKAAAELLAYQFFLAYGLPVIRVRPFNHTGPRQEPGFVCSGLARQVAEIALRLRPPTVVAGNLEAQRDFSDVRDIVRGYRLLLESGRPGEVYQLCSGRLRSIREILEILTGLVSSQVNVEVDGSRIRAHDPPALWGDPCKARSEVGWNPQYQLETTLRDLKSYWESLLQGSGRMRVGG